MGNVNLSRLEGRHKKRDVKVFFAEIDYDEIAVSGEDYQLADMPDEAIVLGATYFPIITNNAGTSMAFDLGLNGGAELISAGDGLTAAGTDVPSTLVPLHLPTGGVLTFSPTYGGTAATAGKVFIYVEYVEYRQCIGELTNFVA